MKEEEKNKQKTSVGESEIQTKAGDFALLLSEVKQRIQLAQTKAVLAVNSELVRLYWDIGRIINARQKQEGWGSAVIPRLARELKNELPELKGFSERNIGRMIAFSEIIRNRLQFCHNLWQKLPVRFSGRFLGLIM